MKMKVWNIRWYQGIAFDRNQAKLTVVGIPDRPGIARHILDVVSNSNIDVDMIVQNVPGIDKT